MKFLENLIPVALILTCVGIGALVYKGYVPEDSFSGNGSVSQRSCTSSSTSKVIGPTNSVILENNPNRSWAKIQMPNSASTTVFLSFDEGTNAVVDSGIMLNGGNLIAGGASGITTTTPNSIEFGRNTDFSYTGVVEGITNAPLGASSTVLVTECSFLN